MCQRQSLQICRYNLQWIILLVSLMSLIFKVILCEDYTDIVDFSNIHTQFINEKFTSTYFNCEPWKQTNGYVSQCKYPMEGSRSKPTYNVTNEITCNASRIKISGLCKYPCEMYITANNSNNSLINNTFVPTNVLEYIIATKIVDKDYFTFTSSIYEVGFYVYVVNKNLERENQLTITYSCENPITPPFQPYGFGFGIGLTIIIWLIIVLVATIVFAIIFLLDYIRIKLDDDDE